MEKPNQTGIFHVRSDNNMWEDKKEVPAIKIADTFIKQKSFITKSGETIRNTPENPTAVEDYLKTLKR